MPLVFRSDSLASFASAAATCPGGRSDSSPSSLSAAATVALLITRGRLCQRAGRRRRAVGRAAGADAGGVHAAVLLRWQRRHAWLQGRRGREHRGVRLLARDAGAATRADGAVGGGGAPREGAFECAPTRHSPVGARLLLRWVQVWR